MQNPITAQQSNQFIMLIILKKGADIVSLIFGEKYYTDKQIYLHFKKIHDKTIVF